MLNENQCTLLVRFIAVGMALFHMYGAIFGLMDAILQRTIHLLLAFLLLLLINSKPFCFGDRFGIWGQKFYRFIIAVCAIFPLMYLIGNYEYLTEGRIQYIGDMSGLQIFLGTLFIIALLELTSRVTGIALPAVCVGFIIFPFVPRLPGVFSHAGYTIAETLEFQYLTFSGVFGAPLAASANFIILFIIFGAFLERCGLGSLMMEFTTGILGHRRGGSAKVAVVASALTGTISGSATANVLSTGALTIPLMKRAGYPPFMAGAIEAAASTGGALMPPIMGTVAFIMSEYSGVPYGMIALYAIIPALLYYLGIYYTVHFAALRYDVKSLDKADLPDWQSKFKDMWHLLLPIVLLVVLLGMDYSPQFSVGYSIIAVIIVSWFRKSTRLDWRGIMEALESGAKGAVLVAVATACAGIIVGVFDQTTVGVKLAQQGNAIAGTLFAGLVITMVVSLVIGLGVPPTVSYLAQIAVTIPMLIAFLTAQGVDPYTAKVSAHFFVMYYSTLAVITPPDALAAVAGAGIAGSPVMKTALHASRVAFVAFVVPFIFIYRPSLLMLGPLNDIIYETALATIAVIVVAAGLEGFGRRPLNLLHRLWAFTAGACLIIPQHIYEVTGLILSGGFLASQYLPEIKKFLRIGLTKPPS